ncbi:MAG: hypothetical protein ACFFG0_09540, partial [Candidatus Thorarchaeota archaeon]
LEIIFKKNFNRLNLKELGIEEINLTNVEKIYTKWLMLEYSDVPIGSNPDALQIMVSKGLLNIDEISYYLIDKNITDQSENNNQEDNNFSECPSCKLNLDEIEEQKNKSSEGQFKYCVCGNCGYSEERKVGKPCQEKICSNCETPLKESNEAPEKQENKPTKEQVNKPEAGSGWDETDSSFRYRVRNPNEFQDNSFRTVPIKKDKPRVNSVMGKLKNEATMKVQSIIFPKEDDWTLDKAKIWLKEHESLTKSFNDDNNIKRNKILDLNIVKKEFDITALPSEPASFLFEIYSKYIDCKVKDLFSTKFIIPEVLKGSYL